MKKNKNKTYLEGCEFPNPIYIKKPMKKTKFPIILAVLDLLKKVAIKIA